MNVKITDTDGKKPSFTQWDVDRVLLISGVDSQPALHFANHELRRAIVVLAEADGAHWTCKVPNFLLQFAGPMAVSVFLQPDEGEGKTVATVVYPVIPKMKPQDYEYEENIGYTNWVQKSEEAQALLDNIEALRDEIATGAATATAAKESAETAASSAGASATAAAQSASAASTSADRAENAAANAGYMFFEIDQNGDLIYHRTPNTQVAFYLHDGDLYVKDGA